MGSREPIFGEMLLYAPICILITLSFYKQQFTILRNEYLGKHYLYFIFDSNLTFEPITIPTNHRTSLKRVK